MRIFNPKLVSKDSPFKDIKVDEDYVIIDTPAGSFHISCNKEKTEISMYDHFVMEITGNTKNNPLIHIDSEEYPTRLKISETEHTWEKG